MILLTGATGMVGRELLCRLVKDNQPVTALFRSATKRDEVMRKLALSDTEKALIHWRQADLNDLPQLEDVFQERTFTGIYHCAGLVSFDVRDKDKLRKINIEGTANLVNLALAYQVQRFCHLSSVAALGSETNQRPITETSPRNNDKTYTYYAISKYGAEMEVWRGSQEGLSVIIVNPAIIIGPGNWHSGSGQLFSRIAKGFNWRIPRTCGFVGVEDLAEIMLQLSQSDVSNERYIVVNQSLSMAEMTDKIARALKVTPPRRPLKKWIIYTLWLAQRLGKLFFNTKQDITHLSLRMFNQQVNYDTSKLQNTLHFTFTPLDESIAKTAEAYRRERP